MFVIVFANWRWCYICFEAKASSSKFNFTKFTFVILKGCLLSLRSGGSSYRNAWLERCSTIVISASFKRCRATSQRLGWERFLRAILKRSPWDVWHLKYNLIDVLYYCITFSLLLSLEVECSHPAHHWELASGVLPTWPVQPDQYDQHWYSVETTCRPHLRKIISVTLVNIKDSMDSMASMPCREIENPGSPHSSWKCNAWHDTVGRLEDTAPTTLLSTKMYWLNHLVSCMYQLSCMYCLLPKIPQFRSRCFSLTGLEVSQEFWFGQAAQLRFREGLQRDGALLKPRPRTFP